MRRPAGVDPTLNVPCFAAQRVSATNFPAEGAVPTRLTRGLHSGCQRYPDTPATFQGNPEYLSDDGYLFATHPAVAACVVTGLPDPGWGEPVQALVVQADGVRAEMDN